MFILREMFRSGKALGGCEHGVEGLFGVRPGRPQPLEGQVQKTT